MTIIPQPTKLTVSAVAAFTLNGGVKISYPEAFEPAYGELYNLLHHDMGMLPEEFCEGRIEFHLSDDLPKEAYSISLKEKLMKIEASDGAGAFYAVQTLKQIFSQSRELTEFELYDEPQSAYRGFMLDSSRYFFPREDVITFLDIMALHKLNKFHWHLTDDQGWRLELYNKLRLAQIGGFRAGTNFNTKPHGGFYSKEDIEGIIAYAKSKYIEIIPEIDTPGHVVSAIAAYPELSCFDRDLSVATHSGVKYDVLCVGKESTFDFVFSVWDEVIEQFKPDVVHLGGDEVPTHRWKHCPHCQKKMKELGFTDESQLHSYYINRLSEYIQSKGVKTVMWCSEEKLENYGVDIIKQFWGTADKKIDTGNSNVIDSCSSAYYFDLPLSYVSLKDCYNYAPSTDEETLGVECCLWTEYVPDMNKAMIMMFPRMAAFCETAWNANNKLPYDEFYAKLDNYCFLLRAYGYNMTNPKKANPGKLKGFGQKLLFERRQLHWQGLHNVIDNNMVAKKARKKGL